MAQDLIRSAVAKLVAHIVALPVLSSLLVGCGGGDEHGSSPATSRAAVLSAATSSAVSPDLLMRWAESAYPQFFSPAGQKTQFSAPYVYRYYPTTQAYLGVAGQDVFVQGAPFETVTPTRMGSIGDYECAVLPSACWEGAEVVPIVPVSARQSAFYADWTYSKSYVIRDAQQWAAAWAEKKDLTWPALPLPAVDFGTYAVLGGTDGWAGSSCAALEAKLILRRGSDYRILWGTRWNEPDGACMGMRVPRVAFVLVPQPVGNVEFAHAPAY